MSGWHAEEITLQRLIVLRRYPDGDPDTQFLSRARFDATAHALITGGRASISGMLVAGDSLKRTDRDQIEALLREHGAIELEADRHGRLVRRLR